MHWVNLPASLFRKKVQLIFFITDSIAVLQGGVLRELLLEIFKIMLLPRFS